MKKTTKRTWMAFLVIALLLLLIGWYPFRMYQETQKMSPLATQEIIKGIYVIKDSFVNCYIIKGNNGYIAVDAGNSRGQVKQEMQKLSIDHQKVLAVFLTHSDSDHVAALDLFTHAKIYFSKDEEQMINGETPRFALFKNKKMARYELLHNGQIKYVSGLQVKGIATPGHTPGSMCYLINDTYLFVGDTMSLKNGKADLFNEFFNMDSETQRHSVKKLAALKKLRYIFTGHYGFTDNPVTAFKDTGR
ncbi:MAG: MBL fold metallo-hydrolase [Deltaproteobacteria bacterium]|nr:MBL fold metallo-hydrolase [Deltaproteobacteria bacterium]